MIDLETRNDQECYAIKVRTYVRIEFPQWFSGNNMFFVSMSKYTGEKSTRMTKVRGDGSLAISLDTTKLDTIQTRFVKFNS